MKKPDLWWLALQPGDRVYVPLDRNKASGMAEVYSNGKKYINVSLNGTSIRIRKDSGCVDQYPNFQVCKDEEDHKDSVRQRKEFRDTLDGLNALARIYGFRITSEHVDGLKNLFLNMAGDR